MGIGKDINNEYELKGWKTGLFHPSIDSFTILPTVHLGTRYVAVGTVDSIPYPNTILAVAYHDNTTVSFYNFFKKN